MDIKKGSPVAKVTIWTDDLKIVLTSALGDPNSDILQIQTNKDFSNPSGTFSITLVPKLDSNGKSWFEKLDAFDYVEIEFLGINDTESTVVMRGLIDQVSKSETWESGVPQRSIVVTGRDLGSLFEDHQIYFMPELSQRKAVEAQIGVISWGGVLNYKEQVNASEAFTTIMQKLESCLDLSFGNGKIRVLGPVVGSFNINVKGAAGYEVPVTQNNIFSYKAVTTFPDDVTSYGHLKTYQGDFWNALAYYQDKPFHEMFLQDFKDRAYLILRPARLKDAFGRYHKSVNDNLNDKVVYPDDFTFTDDDLVSINLQKSHDEIFNYYLTFSSTTLLEKIDQRGVFLDNVGGDTSKSINPFFQSSDKLPAYIGKYGFRKFEASTVFKERGYQAPGQLDEPGSTRGRPFEDVMYKGFKERGVERNQMMVTWFLHNEHLLKGQIDIAGTNRAIIGTYAKNTSDDMEYYVEGVSHSFVQFASFRTTLRVTRGQLSEDKGGLVGLIDSEGLKYESVNRFYFSDIGVRDTKGYSSTAPVEMRMP